MEHISGSIYPIIRLQLDYPNQRYFLPRIALDTIELERPGRIENPYIIATTHFIAVQEIALHATHFNQPNFVVVNKRNRFTNKIDFDVH